MTHQTSLVAVVDDDHRLLESLENLLESAGYRTLVLPTASALLESDMLWQVECVVADVSMSGIDGFGLRDRLQQIRPALTVLLMTGRHEIAEQVRNRLPTESIFRKPFNGRALLEAIDRATKPSRPKV
jgi:FixJ family two-component response regulator